jgi:hypothetical protein
VKNLRLIRRPPSRPEIATCQGIAGQRNGLGAVTRVGAEAKARQALALSGRSPPVGRQARWKTARPTLLLTPRIVSAVSGRTDLPPQPENAASNNDQAERCDLTQCQEHTPPLGRFVTGLAVRGRLDAPLCQRPVA